MTHAHGKPSFRVIVRSTGQTVLETDDWVEAQEHALSRNWRCGWELRVMGVHPSHTWTDGRCVDCGAWNNGSYGSQAPCGYDFGGRALVTAIDQELAARRPHVKNGPDCTCPNDEYHDRVYGTTQ